jgi:hypothetical protein
VKYAATGSQWHNIVVFVHVITCVCSYHLLTSQHRLRSSGSVSTWSTTVPVHTKYLALVLAHYFLCIFLVGRFAGASFGSLSCMHQSQLRLCEQHAHSSRELHVRDRRGSYKSIMNMSVRFFFSLGLHNHHGAIDLQNGLQIPLCGLASIGPMLARPLNETFPPEIYFLLHRGAQIFGPKH